MRGIERWHRAGDLLSLAHIVVALRPRASLPAKASPRLLQRPALSGHFRHCVERGQPRVPS
jgi:nicotinic acid mononucleotide adenylyltransferase